MNENLIGRIKKPVALIVQLAMCGVQFYLLTKADYNASIPEIVKQTIWVFLLPTISLLIIRLTLGKEAAAFGAIPVYIISLTSAFIVAFTHTEGVPFEDMPALIFLTLLKLSAIYAVVGFLPSLIMTSVSSAKEKARDENLK